MSEHERAPDQMQARWSSIYRPDWNETPEAYVEAGLVAWGRSRRLARFDDVGLRVKAYAGVQHYDPARWDAPGAARVRFFLSLFLDNRTVTLRTFATMGEALTELDTLRARLRGQERQERQ